MDNHKTFNNYKKDDNNYPLVEDDHPNNNSKDNYKETNNHYNDNYNKNISRSDFAIGQFYPYFTNPSSHILPTQTKSWF